MYMTHNLGNARVNTIVGKVNIEDFYTIQAVGVQFKPICGRCKYGKCSLGTKDYTIQAENELVLIEHNLTFSNKDNTLTVKYPWIKDPNNLSDNRKVAIAKNSCDRTTTEKNADHAKVYNEQIKDMVSRNVARKL